RLLTGGSRTALPRQQTLRALIDWSYDLLSEAERTLLRRLSVFVGGWTLEAAEAVCSGEGIEPWEVLDLLTQLVDKSLVLVDPGEEGEARYRLLETVRQYSRDRLWETGEIGELRQRHRDWFLQLAEQVQPEWGGPRQSYWLKRFEAEHGNLRAALEWSQAEEEGAEAGLRLAVALCWFWYVGGSYCSEGRAWLEQALARNPEAPAALRAKALSEIARLAGCQGDYGTARSLYEQSLAIRRELEDEPGIAMALNGLGGLAVNQGDYATAQGLFEQSLAIRREMGDKRGIATALNNLGIIACVRGDLVQGRAFQEESLAFFRDLEDTTSIADLLHNLGIIASKQADDAAARALQEESLAMYRQLGNEWGAALCLDCLGSIAWRRGDNTAARAFAEESLTLFRKLDNRDGVAGALQTLGWLHCSRGDYATARRCLGESLRLEQALGNKTGLAEALEGFANLALAEGRARTAARLLGAAEAQREAIGAPLAPGEQARQEQDRAALCRALGEEALAAAWKEGRALTIEQAIALALEEDGG
ncbi:MAG TPA: tetratricopeptide repeat protein, partial [Chthonomonadaceae bacterium]|nr:tetratricopeptide repeat protein [Chthonomonadaceae bacterium]